MQSQHFSNSRWKAFSEQWQHTLQLYTLISCIFTVHTVVPYSGTRKWLCACKFCRFGRQSLTRETFLYKVIRAWNFGHKDLGIFGHRDHKKQFSLYISLCCNSFGALDCDCKYYYGFVIEFLLYLLTIETHCNHCATFT